MKQPKFLYRIEATPFGNPTKVWWVRATTESGARYWICTRIASELGVTSYRVRQYFLTNPLSIEVRKETPKEEI